MKFEINHLAEDKLKSLSERLKHFANENSAAQKYVDYNVKSQNLKLNLSLVFSNIILNLDFVDRSRSIFDAIIREYNKSNKTVLKFDDFERINWVREIAGDVIIPRVISQFIWRVGHYGNEPDAIKIPEDKRDLVVCLLIYSKQCFDDARPTISKSRLEHVMEKFSYSKELTIDFLIENELVGFDTGTNIYDWKGGEYARHLRNEIAATLWLLIGDENATCEQFNKWFKLINSVGIWIDDLTMFLNQRNLGKICQLANQFLENEIDLLKSDAEFRKIWLDSEIYTHVRVEDEVPTVEFDYSNTYNFIDSVNYYKWRFHDIFDYQKTRSFCHSLLRIIVLCEPKYPRVYPSIIKILKDTSRPSLLWILFNDIKRLYPFVIPYLLTDAELIPIAFILIDKIEIDPLFMSAQSNDEQRWREIFELKSQIWMEMFELFLEQISYFRSEDNERGDITAKILVGISQKVFQVNSSSKNGMTEHVALRHRYELALKTLANRRINGNSFPSGAIKPRLVHLILPDIVNYLKERVVRRRPSHIDHLNLDHGLVDLSIEILRICNLRVSESELIAEECKMLAATSDNLISLLENEIIEFYTISEIDVQQFKPDGPIKKKANRGVSTFGFEIIDWAYLYLHFEKRDVLKNLYQNFFSTLIFDTESDKYNDQNREQLEKIKLFLKSLLLAFISINHQKSILELDGLPVKNTLIKLEDWIKTLSLKFSLDDIAKSRIDVFNERFSMFSYNAYYEQLTNLLYRCVNFFDEQTQNVFIKDFFAESNDTGRMLTAINILDSKDVRDIISARIKLIKIDNFIASSFTTTELQFALVEATNSEDHWELAEPLIKRIQNHYNRVKHNDEHSDYLLFEIKLVLAFKEKDYSKLTNLEIPRREHRFNEKHNRYENIKKFFIALYHIQIEKHYDKAILILKTLLSDEPQNVRYAFQLFRVETLKALKK